MAVAPAEGRGPAARAPEVPLRTVTLVAVIGAIAYLLAAFIVDRLTRMGAYGAVGSVLWLDPYRVPAELMRVGLVPYVDFPSEYPPGALPAFLFPTFIASGQDVDGYRYAFESLMAVYGAATVPMAVAVVRRLGGGYDALAGAAMVVGLSPLLMGPIAIARFDPWPALIVATAITASVFERRRLAFALVGLGFVTKVYPAVLVPILVVEAWRRAGRREAVIGLGIAGLVVVAVMAPFVSMAPGPALDPFLRSFARPLQLESLGAAVLVVLHIVTGVPLALPTLSYGSFNLDGALPEAVSRLQTLLFVGGILVALWFAARGSLRPSRLALAIAAALAAEVAFGKVFSPQYVIWLVVPLVVLAPRLGWSVLGATVAILGLTALYYPASYDALVARFDAYAAWLILIRDLVLVAVTGWLIAALNERSTAADAAPDAPDVAPDAPPEADAAAPAA